MNEIVAEQPSEAFLGLAKAQTEHASRSTRGRQFLRKVDRSPPESATGAYLREYRARSSDLLQEHLARQLEATLGEDLVQHARTKRSGKRRKSWLHEKLDCQTIVVSTRR